jgi:hypothetical protein
MFVLTSDAPKTVPRGIGEGNRTLVFSLEGSKNCSVFIGRSDIVQLFRAIEITMEFLLVGMAIATPRVSFSSVTDRRAMTQPSRVSICRAARMSPSTIRTQAHGQAQAARPEDRLVRSIRWLAIEPANVNLKKCCDPFRHFAIRHPMPGYSRPMTVSLR